MWTDLLYSVNLSDILGIIAILAAFVIAYIGLKKNQEKQILSWLLIMFIICGFAMISKHESTKKYCQVPNVCGLTYDEALSSLTSTGLAPQLVLASGNDLSLPTCRVLWQSLSPGEIANKNEQCLLLLDDYYLSRASSVAAYKLQFKNTTYTAYFSVDKSNDEHPNVKIELSPYHLTTAPGSNRTYLFESTRIDDYSNTLSTDSFIAEMLAESAGHISQAINDDSDLKYWITNLDGVMSFVRLTSVENRNEQTETYTFDKDGVAWLAVLPKNLIPGEYSYEFAVAKKDGTCYEWRIPVIMY